jgi:hypothetical protein
VWVTEFVVTRETPATGDVGLMVVNHVAPVPIGSPMVVAPVKSSKGPIPTPRPNNASGSVTNRTGSALQRERHVLIERRLKDDPTTLEELSRHYGMSRESGCGSLSLPECDATADHCPRGTIAPRGKPISVSFGRLETSHPPPSALTSRMLASMRRRRMSTSLR